MRPRLGRYASRFSRMLRLTSGANSLLMKTANKKDTRNLTLLEKSAMGSRQNHGPFAWHAACV